MPVYSIGWPKNLARFDRKMGVLSLDGTNLSPTFVLMAMMILIYHHEISLRSV
jgi:hypothetical protein